MRETNPPVQIGPWIAEPGLNRISRGATVLQLDADMMTVLMGLAGRAGEIVPGASLAQTQSHGAALDEDRLAQVIGTLRNMLGDDEQGRALIEIIPDRGYRMAAEVGERDADAPDLQMPAMPMPDVSDHRQGLTLLVAAALGISTLAMMAFQHFFGD